MQVVGADKLDVFLRQHVEAAGALRAFHALAVHAAWSGPDDLRRQFGAVIRFAGPGQVQITLAEQGCRIDLLVNYALGLMRIEAVVDLGAPQANRNGEQL